MVEELDPTQGDGAGTPGPFLDILDMEEVVPELFFSDLIGGFVIVLGKLPNGPNIHLLSALSITFELKVIDHSST